MTTDINNSPHTPINVKDYFETNLGTYLGTYTYPSGYQRTAIAIGNPQNDVDVKGVELVLPFFPEIEESFVLNEQRLNERHQQQTWDLYFIHHYTSQQRFDQNFADAIQTTINHLLRDCNGTYLPQDSRIENLPQYRITFRFSDIV